MPVGPGLLRDGLELFQLAELNPSAGRERMSLRSSVAQSNHKQENPP